MVKGDRPLFSKPRVIYMFLTFTASIILGQGCSHGNCNNLPGRPTEEVHAKNINETKAEATKLPPVSEETFLTIYKDSGEKQCDPKSGIPIDKLKALLTKNKIVVLESKTQSDGKMRIQVCGASAGQMHTFLIEKKYAAKALKLGFKQFKNSAE